MKRVLLPNVFWVTKELVDGIWNKDQGVSMFYVHPFHILASLFIFSDISAFFLSTSWLALTWLPGSFSQPCHIDLSDDVYVYFILPRVNVAFCEQTFHEIRFFTSQGVTKYRRCDRCTVWMSYCIWVSNSKTIHFKDTQEKDTTFPFLHNFHSLLVLNINILWSWIESNCDISQLNVRYSGNKWSADKSKCFLHLE